MTEGKKLEGGINKYLRKTFIPVLLGRVLINVLILL